MSDAEPTPLNLFLVATEESGDRLGGALMHAIRQRTAGAVRFSGVGGDDMTAAGLSSLFPVGDFSIIGFTAIPRRLPSILRRIRETAKAATAARPHALVVIDSPAFNLRVARKVRAADPSIPIIDYVSPTVWAWRSGRARTMRAFVDHVLALLPFEPAAHERLGGPPCSYVGHPLAEQAVLLRPNADEMRRREQGPPVVLAMIGSRSAEVRRMAGDFGGALGLVAAEYGPIEVVVPTVPHLVEQVRAVTAGWRFPVRVVVERDDKNAAMRSARAALAKSGTNTLELAVAGVPMVAAYRGSSVEAFVAKRLVKVPSAILANLVIGDNVVPELMQQDCTPQALARELLPLLSDTPARRRQLEGFARLDNIMEIGAVSPAARAAEIVLRYARREATRRYEADTK